MNLFKKVGNKPLSASHLCLWKTTLSKLDIETIKTANLADYREKPQSKEMVLGQAFHELLFEPKKYKENLPKWRMKITQKDMLKLINMAGLWMKTPQTSTLLDKTKPQESETIIGAMKDPEILTERQYNVDFTCEDGSVIPLTAIFDLISPDNNIAMDLKTSATLSGLNYVSNKLYYNIKIGFYALVYELAFKRKLKAFTLIGQETTGKFETGFQEIMGDTLQEFIDYAKQNIEEYKIWRKEIDKHKLKDETFKRVKITEFKK